MLKKLSSLSFLGSSSRAYSSFFFWQSKKLSHVPAGICLFKVNNENIRKIFKIGIKMTIETARCHFVHTTDFIRCSGVSIVDFEQFYAG